MKDSGGKIICCIIISIAIVICANMFTKTNFFQGNLNTTGNFNGSVTMYEGQNIGRLYDEVLSIYEAASYLRMEESILKSTINNGNTIGIPYISTGGQIIFSKKALDEWVYSTSKSKLNSKP